MTSKLGMVALLPMKAQSVRVVSKNFRKFAGRPLYRWVLETLLKVPDIEKVVINTDARKILEASGLRDGDADGRVQIRDRKPELCGDLVSMNLVIADDVEAIDASAYLMTHTTNPLLSSATIREAIDQYSSAVVNGTADSLFTVNRFQTRFYRQDGSAINHDPNNLIRTQDLEPWFEENSNLYLFSRESFKATRARIGQNPLMMEVPRQEAADIDGPDDWAIAEAIALYNRSLANGESWEKENLESWQKERLK